MQGPFMTPLKRISSIAIFVVLSIAMLAGCQGLGASGPTPTPTPAATPAGSLQSVNHIIFMMQENRSFDSYFGKINDYRASLGLGRDADDLETDFTNPTDSPDTQQIRTFHLGTSCIYNTSAAWLESHGNANRFDTSDSAPLLLDGFVHTAAGLAIFDGDPDTKGVRSMGYYTQSDLPSPYWFATQFAMSDRFYNPEPAQTEDTRLYAMAATSQGLVHPPQDTNTTLTAKTIFQLLDAAGISWKIYLSDPNTAFIGEFQPFGSQHNDKIEPLDAYFEDLKNGTLPSVAFIEGGYKSGLDEHPDKNIQPGAAHVASVINALMSSSSWKDSVFILTFDEGGNFFDHVPPQPAVSPDDVPPGDLGADDICANGQGSNCDFNHTGFRVPLIVVSPFTKKHFVSHTVADYTAILKFIETRFGLSSLSKRDAAQMDMTEFFDFTNPPWMTPPSPPEQSQSGVCDYSAIP